MKSYQIFFGFILFFLIGVFAASFLIFPHYRYLIFSLAVTLACLASVLFKKYLWLILLFGFLGGAFYYFYFDATLRAEKLLIGELYDSKITIKTVKSFDKYQKLIVNEFDNRRIRLELKTPAYPEYLPGDILLVSGKLLDMPMQREEFYLKDRIIGVINYPRIQVVDKNIFTLNRILHQIKSSLLSAYYKVLQPQSAIFLGGLNFGEDERFPLDLREKMRLTGTLHLTALSGYNIALLINFLIFILAGFISRRWQLIIITAFLVLFVIMTGAEASVVRAAIMASILMVANHAFRSYKIHLVIILTSFIMVLINPKILAWDVGFQLSFLSLLGIIYLSPLIKDFIGFKNPGILGWKENFMATLSALIMVLPISLYHFGSFSLIAILTNIFILTLIPATMLLGFFLNFFSLISYWLAFTIGQVLNIFLGLELFIINLFSVIPIRISFNRISAAIILLYYASLACLVLRRIRPPSSVTARLASAKSAGLSGGQESASGGEVLAKSDGLRRIPPKR